ncbi:C40 family peptidase [Candidatus Poribacteria bacterium]|nr:C40 family peptidase [Candidatus Poribacteria bacterium]
MGVKDQETIENESIVKIKKCINEWIEKNNYTTELISITFELNPQINKLTLSGKVLLSKQKIEIENEFKKINNFYIINNLDVVSSPQYNGSFEWAHVKEKKVNVRRFKNQNDISTQITSSDNVFKIFYKDDKESLIQLEDLTLGWVYNYEIVTMKAEGRRLKAEEKKGEPDYWQNIIRPDKDKIIEVNSLHQLFLSAQKYLNTPYLLGGKSEDEGMDCSGFMQLIFKQAFNLILPKHALEQSHMGKRIALKDISSGDLIFARVKGKNIFHVGLVWEVRSWELGVGSWESVVSSQEEKIENQKKDINVIHASKHAKKVICESIDEFYKKYIPAGARRIIVERNEEGASPYL